MKVLALSPHTDDVELGCGGYLTKLHEGGHDISVGVFATKFHGQDLETESFNSLMHVTPQPIYGAFEVRRFSRDRQVALDSMIKLRKQLSPDLVLLPSSSDIHQDHQVIHEEGVRAFSKDCSVLGYEMPWNCRDFCPTFYAELRQKHLTGKWKMLECYRSQIELGRPYFQRRFIDGWARMRGQQIKREFAEAFEVITWID